MILEEIHHKSCHAEDAFKYKKILFIPSEKYDPGAITIMQGLQKLGFAVYTIGRGNISSWWFNRIIHKPWRYKFDFVLSNMGVGIKWSFYDKYNLRGHLKVLLDGGENRANSPTWREKHAIREREYPRCPPSEREWHKELHRYRWMESLGSYEPDVVFTCHKNHGDEETFYWPHGIHEQSLAYYQGKSGFERAIDFTNIPGRQAGRNRLTAFVALGKLPGKVHNRRAKDRAVIPSEIAHLIEQDAVRGAHAWRRWIYRPDFYAILNSTKVFIYPNIVPYQWGSMRIWESLASGCLALIEHPVVEMSQYPVTELCPMAQFADYDELVDKAKWLYSDQDRLECLRLQVHEGALRYFTAIPMARYFLWRIATVRDG